MAKPKIAYVTLLDQYHPGIYDSQVIDVCHYLQNNFNVNVKLIAFLSIRELKNTEAKRTIKSKYPNSWVFPAFPKLKYFELTRYLLAFVLFFNRYTALICRNVFAAQIGLFCKRRGLVKKVAFDGRSALASEIKEYDVFPVDYLRNNIASFERIAATQSDFQIAISNALVAYWKDNYQYKQDTNIIIPCTLHSDFDWTYTEESISEKAIRVVYAGSNAPWQGFKEIGEFLRKHPSIYCTLLTKASPITVAMENEFGERLTIKWLPSKEVAKELANHDYGLLLRPQTNTNKVASPGKFAEYLSCGLPVILSKNLGDYSGFVQEHNCGLVWDGKSSLYATKTGKEMKVHCHQLAKEYFRKESTIIHQKYQTLINALINE